MVLERAESRDKALASTCTSSPRNTLDSASVTGSEAAIAGAPSQPASFEALEIWRMSPPLCWVECLRKVPQGQGATLVTEDGGQQPWGIVVTCEG